MEDYEIDLVNRMREEGHEGSDSELLCMAADGFNEAMSELGFEGDDLVDTEQFSEWS